MTIAPPPVDGRPNSNAKSSIGVFGDAVTTATPNTITTEPPLRLNTRIRSVLFWMHLVTGVVVGLVVAIMSVTGAAVAYEKHMLDRAATKHHVAPITAGAVRLSLDSLYERAITAIPNQRVASLTVYADTTVPIALGLDSRQSLFVDPYNATVLGNDASVRSFMNVMLKWHRSLNMGATVRSPVGTAITGASNLAFLFLIISGYVLWFPRQWSRRAFAAVVKFNPRVRGRARDWNWHHVLGFWSAPILFLIVASATFISYSWPATLLESIAGSGVPASTGEGGRGGERAPRAAAATPPATAATEAASSSVPLAKLGVSLDSLQQQAAKQVDHWRTIQIRMPAAAAGGGGGGGRGGLSVTASRTVTSLPNERVQFSLDRKTRVLNPSAPAANGLTGNAAKIRPWMRPLHTGEAGGIVGQTLAALVSLATAVLFYTGMTLSWRRLRRRMRSAQR